MNIQKELQRKIISCCDSFLFIRSLPISVGAVVEYVVVIVVDIELNMDVKLVVIFSLVTGSVKTAVVSEIFESIYRY